MCMSMFQYFRANFVKFTSAFYEFFNHVNKTSFEITYLVSETEFLILFNNPKVGFSSVNVVKYKTAKRIIIFGLIFDFLVGSFLILNRNNTITVSCACVFEINNLI